MIKLDCANNCINAVRRVTDSAILFCSMGKDSIVLLDMLYGRFDRLVCVFMYFVPGLEHIERWVRWVRRRYPRVEMMQVPHWNLSYLLRGGLYCVPNPDVRLLKLSDVVRSVRRATGIHHVFLGMKKADGMNRALMLKTYEATNYENKGMVYPLAEWNQRDVLAYMRQHRLPQPVRYSLKASGGVGFNEDCFVWMREHFPEDLERIYKTFPMSRRILYEYDKRRLAQCNEEETDNQL